MTSNPNERQHRQAIVQFGRMLHENGFVAATDGNLSVRLDSTRLLVTPTYISKGRMRASDMVIAVSYTHLTLPTSDLV